MRPVTAPLAGLLLIVAALTTAACGASGSSPSSSPSTTTGGPPPSSPVDGIVTQVNGTSLTNVSGFTLRTADGRTLVFRIGQLENAADFPPGHLTEHQGQAIPVRVTFHVQDGELIATRLEDAPIP